MMKISIKYVVLSILGIAVLTYYISNAFAAVFPLTTDACTTTTTSERAIATELATAPSFTKNLVTSSGVCINDPKTAFAPYKIPTYDDLKSLYYDQSKLAKSGSNQQLYTLTGDQTGEIDLRGRDKVYYIRGNLSLDSPSDITGNQTGIIFVNGNLLINPSNKKLTQPPPINPNSGLVFVVKGDVNIGQDVEQIDTVIISEGIICTAYAGGVCPSAYVLNSQPLVINGSLISLKQPPITDPNASYIKFRRSLANNNQPAETINHQVKYLVILRDLMSDTFQRWSEIP